MVSTYELDSFIYKFRYLCCAGFKSSLTLRSENGQAYVSFDVNLGALATPVTLPPPGYCKKPRSPSYFRRQEKRRQERTKIAAEEAKGESCNEVDDLTTFVKTAGNAAVCEDDENPKYDSKDFESSLLITTSDSENVMNDNLIDAEESKDDHDDYFDKQEATRNKLVDEIFVYATPEPIEKVDKVEDEIRERFAKIDVKVISMKSSRNPRGHFKQSLLKIEPTNLNRIWGRRLGLAHCAIISARE